MIHWRHVTWVGWECNLLEYPSIMIIYLYSSVLRFVKVNFLYKVNNSDKFMLWRCWLKVPSTITLVILSPTTHSVMVSVTQTFQLMAVALEWQHSTTGRTGMLLSEWLSSSNNLLMCSDVILWRTMKNVWTLMASSTTSPSSIAPWDPHCFPWQ